MPVLNKPLPNNPIQPMIKDGAGMFRFKQNALVSALLDAASRHGLDMNWISRVQASADDRQQFAQLIGYSLHGYSSLPYVDDDAYNAAVKMTEGKSEEAARIEALTEELKAVREGLRDVASRLFGVHPDDLKKNG